MQAQVQFQIGELFEYYLCNEPVVNILERKGMNEGLTL